ATPASSIRSRRGRRTVLAGTRGIEERVADRGSGGGGRAPLRSPVMLGGYSRSPDAGIVSGRPAASPVAGDAGPGRGRDSGSTVRQAAGRSRTGDSHGRVASRAVGGAGG